MTQFTHLHPCQPFLSVIQSTFSACFSCELSPPVNKNISPCFLMDRSVPILFPFYFVSSREDLLFGDNIYKKQHIEGSQPPMIPTIETNQYLTESPVPSYRRMQHPTNPNQPAHDPHAKTLLHIVNKHRKLQYIKTFVSKLRRNNVYQPPPNFQLQTEACSERFCLFRLEGIDFKYKTVEGFIFAGDIVFSIIVFIIAVFQAFLQDFRTETANTFTIVMLKVLAIGFEFSKLLLKAIKKDMVKGKLLVYIGDILRQSIGLAELLLYLSAICMIFITITNPLNDAIGILAFVIATVKLFKIPVNLRVLDLFYIDSQTKQAYWNLAKVIIFQLLFLHFISGLLLAMTRFNSEVNWMITHDLTEQSWDVRYSYAMYWAATLITSTGFGDYVATNQQQAMFVAFLQLFSSVVLVYNINLIGTIIMNIRSSTQSQQKKRGIFKRMTDEYPITRNLQEKIISYIDFQRQISERFEHKERYNLLKELPEQLKNQYYNDVNQTIFRSLPYFRNLRLEVLGDLASNFKSRVYYPGEDLIPHKSQRDSIFILRRGQVSLKYQKIGGTLLNGTTVQTIRVDPKSNNLPVLLSSAFIDRSRDINFDFVAAEYSLIMNLHKDNFMKIIRQSSIETEHYFTIYDKHQNNLNFEGIKCESCEECHTKFQCPKLHYFPFKNLMIGKYLLENGRNQVRIPIKKESKRKEHCYYLRKDFFRAYEGQQNIVERDIPAFLVKRLIKMKAIAEYFNQKDMLQAFQNMFRTILIEKKQAHIQQNDKNMDVDIAHNYLSYFAQHNSKLLHNRMLRKKAAVKKRKLQHKLTILSTSSKKNLYRMPAMMEEERSNSNAVFF